MPQLIRHNFKRGLLYGTIFSGFLLIGFGHSLFDSKTYNSVSISPIDDNRVNVVYYYDKQGTYVSPDFNQIKLKQTTTSQPKLYFYNNNHLVKTHYLAPVDVQKLERRQH